MTKARDNATQGGLVLITKATFTTAATVQINNVFSSSYDNYLVKVSCLSSTAYASLNLRFSTNGTPQSGNIYYYAGHRSIYNGSSGIVSGGPATSIGGIIPDMEGGNWSNGDINFFYPYATDARTVITTLSNSIYPITSYGGGQYLGAAERHDGFTLFASSGNLTGNLKVYGIKG